MYVCMYVCMSISQNLHLQIQIIKIYKLVHKCNSKHKCPLCVNLKPSDIFHSSLTNRKYVTKCDDKNINTLSCSTSDCIYLIDLITCCRCGLHQFGKTVQYLRDRFSDHRTGKKNLFVKIDVKYLANILVLVFEEIQITQLTSQKNYLDLQQMTMVYLFLM